MQLLRRLKSLAYGRSSAPDSGKDNGNKSANEEQECATKRSWCLSKASVKAKVAYALEKIMAAGRIQPVMNGAGLENSSMFSTEIMDTEQLPKEIYAVKIQDASADSLAHNKELLISCNGTEAVHILVTTLAGPNGQPKQVLKTFSYMAEKIVGTGSFGEVFQATCLETGEVVAIKKVLQDKCDKSHELQIMHMLDHPNVVTFKHGFFSNTVKDELYLNLVMEYVPKNLSEMSKQHKNINQQKPLMFKKVNQRMPLIYIKLYTYQICRALAYLHNGLGIIHTDVKPQNLLVDPHSHELKLCGFGSAKMLHVHGEQDVADTCLHYYRAPELIFGARNHTSALDIWSMGCVLAELLLGEPLFAGESTVDQLVEIIKVLGTPTKAELKSMNPGCTGLKLPVIQAFPWHKVFSKRTPTQAIDLISGLLQYTPDLRCTALEACVHPFFDELRNRATRLPDGCPLPPLFNFKAPELKGATSEVLEKLLPRHT